MTNKKLSICSMFQDYEMSIDASKRALEQHNAHNKTAATEYLQLQERICQEHLNRFRLKKQHFGLNRIESDSLIFEYNFTQGFSEPSKRITDIKQVEFMSFD